MENLYIPDTSAIIEEQISGAVEAEKIKGTILIHKAVLALLERGANTGDPAALTGLDELKKLKDLASLGRINLDLVGDRPSFYGKAYFKSEDVDWMVRETAIERKGCLLSCDRIQIQIAEAEGIKAIHFEPVRPEVLKIEKFFDDATMSIHLKENVVPCVKRGLPGNFDFLPLSSKELSRQEIEEMAKEVVESAKYNPEGFIEAEREGSSIVRYKNYRIVITRPPFSDGWEITATKPIKMMNLSDYHLPERLLKRISFRAEGILVAGAPGMGKSTFARALAQFYQEQGKIVKTIESPRDLNLPPAVTRYSKPRGETGEIHDIILLTRPDYTIFDEMRSGTDFRLFSDLRLAGVGMVGILHATSSIDAVQRFVQRFELGMIPSIIDTLIFIKRGKAEKIYGIKMAIKMPSGMAERDLTRPVIEIKDFVTGRLEYELYTFGEKIVVVPVKEGAAIEDKESALRRGLGRWGSAAKIEMEEGWAKVFLPQDALRVLLNRGGKRLKRLEKTLKVAIEVEKL